MTKRYVCANRRFQLKTLPVRGYISLLQDQFCKIYYRAVKNPFSKLKAILTSMISVGNSINGPISVTKAWPEPIP